MTLSYEMLGLLAPALIAGIIIASTHVPLGQEVLRRGIIFIDLAIAQVAALGAVFTHVMFPEQLPIYSLIFAFIFALTAGGIFSLLEKRITDHLEAFIGATFVLSASLAILLLANDPHGNENMQDMLAGQILWVNWTQIIVTAVIYVAVLFVWFRFAQNRNKVFYLLFPVVVTLSVQLAGVYLVFASLIIPALCTAQMPENKRLSVGYMIAVLAFVIGLVFSTIWDLPSGPTIVVAYPVAGIIWVLITRSILNKA